MDDNQYKIELGVKLDTSDLKTEIAQIDGKHKVKLGVNLSVNDIRDRIRNYNKNTNNIKVKLKATLDTDDLKRQIGNLNLGVGGKGVAIPVNTESLEFSLREVSMIIKDIRNSLGTIDDKSDMKSLVVSINQITTALEKATNESDGLVASLKALSQKDFSVNFGIKLGGDSFTNNALYGNEMRNNVIPKLKKQIDAMVREYNKQMGASADENEALLNLAIGTKFATPDFLQGFYTPSSNTLQGRMANDKNLKEQARALREYINLLQQAAKLKGLDLDPVISGFSETPDELIKGAEKIKTGITRTTDSVERLKSVLNSGLDVEGLSTVLKPLLEDIKAIRETIQGLSKGFSIDNITSSFREMSDILDTLTKNLNVFKDVLGNAGKGLGGSVDGATQGLKNSADVLEAFKKSLQNIGMSDDEIESIANQIKNLGVQIETLNQKKLHIPGTVDEDGNPKTQAKDILTVDVSGVDGFGNAVKLTQEYDIATAKLVKSIDKVSTVQQKAGKSTDTFAKQQKRAVTDLTNQINQINRSAVDQNAARPIKDTSHLESLSSKYNEIIAAIERMGNASNDTFEEERNKVRTLIAEYKSLKSEYKNAENVSLEMDGNDFTSGLEIAKNKLAEFKAQAKDFSQLTPTIEKLDKAIEDVGNVSSLKEFNNQLRVAKSELSKVKAEMSSNNDDLVKKIRIDIESDKFENQMSQMYEKFNKLSDTDGSLDKLRADIKRVEDAYESMYKAAHPEDGVVDNEKLIQSQKEYAAAIEKVSNQLRIQTREQRAANAAEKLADDKANLKLDMLNWLKNNTKATKEYKGQIDALIASLDKLDQAGTNGARRKFNSITKDAELKGKTGLNAFDSLKSKFAEYAKYLSAAEIFMYAEQGLRSMFEQVKLIDSAMTELKKVTNETDAVYDEFLTNAADRAKEIGTTIDGLVSSTADFARLGYGFQDAQGLAEVANIYAVVGDEIEGVEGATKSLISTMAAFKDSAGSMSNSDFAMSIVDKFNEIGNNFSISSGGIGEALERSASSLDAANNTLDESIALITASNQVVQDPAAVGQALKTISMRIRGAKTEMEEAGLETEGMVESTAKLRSEILALSGVDIMENANEFKSTYKIMDELAVKWQDLSDIQQATVTELIAGKRQGNIVSSLMSNFDTAREALETSMGSTGSAMEEHAKWSESLEARLNKLSAAWQALSQSFLNSDFLKVTLESVIALVDGLTKLTDTLGTLGTISLGTGIFTLIKSGGLKTFIQSLLTLLKFTPDLDTFGSKVKHVGTSIGDAGRAAKMSMGGFSSWAAGISIAITAISLIVNAIKNAHEEASRVRQEAIQESDEFLNSLDSFEGAYIKYSGRTNLTAEEEAELETAIKGTVDALGDKSSALQGVVNSSNDYVASLEAITKAELKAAESAAKEKQKNAKLELESIAQGWTSLDGSELNVNLELGASSGDLAQSNELIRIAKEIGGDFYYQTSSGYRTKQHDYTLRLSGNDDADTILDYYYTLIEYRDRLLNLENFDTDKDIQSVYEGVNAAISKVSETVKIYESGLYDLAKAEYQIQNGIPKTTEAYVEMREAILGREDIARTDFNTRKNIASALDSEYGQYFDLSSVEVQARKFIGLIKGYGDGTKDGTNEIGTVETFLNMRTAVNNNECSVGDYLSQFDEINKITKNWSEEEKKEFNTSFGLDTDSIKAQYDEMRKYLFRKVPIEVDERTENEIENFLNSLTADELQAVIDIKTDIDWKNTNVDKIRKQIEDQVRLNEALRFSTSIEVDKTALEALNTVLEESASAMGLSEESIDSLKAKYSDLEGYNPHTLFEKTANGVKVNREELAKLEEKYNDLTKTEVQEHLDTLVEEYNKCTKAIDGNIGSQEKLELISKREKYAQQIEELAEYQAQLEGVTGAYQRWIDAQNTPQEYEGYQSIATSREDIEDEISRGFLSSATKEYIDLLSGKDLVGGSIDDYYNAWKKLDEKIDSTGYSINDFFTVNEDGDITSTGIDRFFKGMQQDFKGSVAEFNKETGQWEYDFSQENLQKIQDEWGIGIEAIELLLEAAVAAGYNVDWGGIFDDLDIDTSNFESVEAMISLAEKAQEEFNKLKGVEDVEFNFRTNTIEEATTEVEKARKAYLDLITNDDGSINLKAEGAEQMQFILATLLTQKQQLSTPAIMKVDTSQIDKAKTDVIDVVNKAKELQTAYENYEIAITTGVDVESAKKDLNTAIDGMKGASVDVRADLKLPTNEELTNAANSLGSIKVGASLDGTSIGAIATKIQTECTPEVIAKVTGLDETAIQNGSQQVVYTAEHSDVDNFINGLSDISKKIIYTYETSNNKPNPSNIERTITYKYETEGDVPEVNGTANVNGTAQSGRAFARGNWGIKGSGTALVGELGMETLVRGSRFYTIGDNGAEFIKYKQGDIIFNHKQTEELFKNGKVTSDGGRGRMFANGSAFAEGTALWQASASGSKFATNRLIKTGGGSSKKTKKDNSEKKNVSVNTTVAEDKNATSVKTDVNYNANVSESDFAKENQENQNKGGKGKEKFEETWDWIAIAIERIEREIDNLDKKVNNTYKSWGDRNTALSQEIAEVGKEIALQNDAADEYWNRAGKSLDHNSTYAKQIQNGTLNIEDFEGEGDEALVEKIKEYQKW